MLSKYVSRNEIEKSNHTPYLFAQIPVMRAVPKSLRIMREYDPGIFRTVRFSNTHFQNVPFEWDALVGDLETNMFVEFKR